MARSSKQQRHSAVFIADFSDGEVTRMTVHTPLDKLDVGRGVRLARHAYRSRTKKEPGAIINAHFEKDGMLLRKYAGGDLSRVK